MAIDQSVVDDLRKEPGMPDIDLSWLREEDAPGIKAKIGRRGLTLDEINKGTYGDVPELATKRPSSVSGALLRTSRGILSTRSRTLWRRRSARSAPS
jgi:hypothetical protein